MILLRFLGLWIRWQACLLFELAQVLRPKHGLIGVVLEDLRYVFGVVVGDLVDFLLQILQVHIPTGSELLLQMLRQTEISWLPRGSSIALILGLMIRLRVFLLLRQLLLDLMIVEALGRHSLSTDKNSAVDSL